MSRVPVLRGLRVSCRETSVHLGWQWAGASTHVRVLRSTECFCESPDAHAAGEWGQELVYEGRGGQLLDAAAGPDHDLFYSIFARGHGPWRRPIHVCVRRVGHQPPDLGVLAAEGSLTAAKYAPGRLMGDRYVEIAGEDEAAPVVGGSRDWLVFVVPVVTLALLTGFLRGVDWRVLTVAALAIAACWRLLDGLQPDLRRFLAYLKVVAVIDGMFWAAALLISFFRTLAPSSAVQVDHSVLLFWLYPLLLLAGMAGVWLLMSRALDDRGRPIRPLPYLALAALLGLAAVLPPLPCALMAVFGIYDSVRSTRQLRRQRAAHLAELQASRRREVHEVYTAWRGLEGDPTGDTPEP